MRWGNRKGNSDGHFELTGRHVWFGFAGFFGLIFISNAVMMYLAVSTFPGLETNASYKASRNYNQQIDAARLQRDLGWSTRIETRATAGGDHVIRIAYKDDQDRPVDLLSLEGILKRRVHRQDDITLLFERIDNGTYQANISGENRSGNWSLSISAESQTGHVHRTERKVYLAP